MPRKSNPNSKRSKQLNGASSASSSSSSGSNSKRTLKSKGETLWVGMGNLPITIRQGVGTVYTIVESLPEATLVQTTGFANTALEWELNYLGNLSAYQTLFDQYKFAAVEVTIRPQFTTGQSGMLTPSVYSVIDYDDNAALTSSGAFRDYSNCTITQYETVVRKFTPHVVGAASIANAFTGRTSVAAPWVDIVSDTVSHFGLKVGMDAGSGTFQRLIINVTLRLEFQTTR